MNIPAHCLATEATLVDAVRRITPKEDQDFCLAHWFQMRNLRNTLVEFAGGNTKQNPTRLIIVKEKDTQDQNAVRIDHAALYHLFSSDQSNGADKLAFSGYFMLVNQYKLQFIGYKTTQQIKPAKPIKDVPRVVDDQSKEVDKQLVKTHSQVTSRPIIKNIPPWQRIKGSKNDPWQQVAQRTERRIPACIKP
ncbi:hypothetical protein G6F42_023402 [Rhizopus arrhizus]|nr:hypothetical protein G6F42_023402 [Rhizopus arrhizus]